MKTSARKKARHAAGKIPIPAADIANLSRELEETAYFGATQQAPQSTSYCASIILGYSQEQDRINAKMAGFDQFFVKPFAPILLAGLLTQLQA